MHMLVFSIQVLIVFKYSGAECATEAYTEQVSSDPSFLPVFTSGSTICMLNPAHYFQLSIKILEAIMKKPCNAMNNMVKIALDSPCSGWV